MHREISFTAGVESTNAYRSLRKKLVEVVDGSNPSGLLSKKKNFLAALHNLGLQEL